MNPNVRRMMEEKRREQMMAKENALRAMVRECLGMESRLTDWEKNFLQRVAQVSQLSPKQAQTVTSIWRKLKAPVAKLTCVLSPGRGIISAPTKPAALGEKGYSV